MGVKGIHPPERIFIKFGGSLITDKSKPYTARLDVIDRLCREIHDARAKRGLSLLVGHGGGSFPHVSATQYQTAKGVVDERSWEGFVKVHDDAAHLNAIVCEAFGRAGELAATVQPSAACVARAGRISQWFTKPIELILEAGLVPVVYGDVCLDQKQGMCIISTEEIFRCLAGRLNRGPSRVILLGKVDGVFDRRGSIIPVINKANLAEVRPALVGSDGVADVTGGMLHKVERSLELGLRTEILNGLTPGVLLRSLLGDQVPGTVLQG
jgi:isopentenyl phosphate kinase